MKKRSTVIVGIDFSAPSRRALDIAVAVAARAGARVELLHVWNPNHLAGSGAVHPELESWILEQKHVLAAQLERWSADAAGSAPVSATVIEGVASRVLPERAHEVGAGLIVVGRRGSANLAHVLLGSVSERVVHLAPCPVLVVPEQTRVAVAPERLLVGVDFSQAAREALEAASELAATLGVKRGIVVAHARPRDPRASLENWSEHDHPGRDEPALERWAARSSLGGVTVSCRIVPGSPEMCLVAAADREACDWLVLGQQGRTALAAFPIGSATHRILKLADRPVLVVPRKTGPPGEGSS